MHPVLFTIGGSSFPIHAYGVMLGISFVSGYFIALYMARRNGIGRTDARKVVAVTAICAMLGAKILYLTINFMYVYDGTLWSLVQPGHTGMVALGGFFGGGLGAWGACRAFGVSFLDFADGASLSAALGLGVTRLGCLMYGCDYGKVIPVDAPSWLKSIGMRFPNWEVRYPDLNHMHTTAREVFHGSAAFVSHARDDLVDADSALSLLVYPTQLLSSFNGFVAFVMLGVLVWRRLPRERQSGDLFFLFCSYYGVTRFLLEFLRDDAYRGFWMGLSTSQWFSLLCLVLGVVWFGYGRKKKEA